MFYQMPPAPPAIIVVQDVASSCVPFDWCRPATKENDDRGSGRVDQKGKN